MPNKLAAEKSPYLLQHADNPVDWLPWGEEALERARREDKPILVSIGYSACHWCHVMAHESFEDAETAQFMNEHFVNIKVDREERPDVDAVYMEAVQAMTGRGGWPLNVFLAPDGRPFFGGTYFPSGSRAGMPNWRQVLERIATLYSDEKDVVTNNAEAMTRYLLQAQQTAGATDEPAPQTLKSAFESTLSQIDWVEGGFGGAPKFPQPLALEFLLRMSLRWRDESARSAVELGLHKMAEGGIFDQLGGGFHRYSVDGYWLVPHFEKMLYDNALLARVYVQAFQLTHDPFYRDIAVRTLDYLHDMRSPEGGFFSAEDADSEGVEGKYYVWSTEELEEILGSDAARIFGRRYGATKDGNFEGENILHLVASINEVAEAFGATGEEIEKSLAESRQKLLEARAKRVAPATDTKILASWNALAIGALAEAGRVFDRTDYIEAATRAAHFLLTSLRPGGRLMRSFKDGPSNILAFLEDYAYLAEALLTLYETAFDVAFLKEAEVLIQQMVELFWDGSQQRFFDTAAESQTGLPVRSRSLFDNPIPSSGNSAATFVILRWMALTGDEQFGEIPKAVFRSVKETLIRAPLAFSYLLSALDFHLSAPMQIAIVGEPGDAKTRGLVDVVFDLYLPNKVVSVGQPDETPLLAGKSSIDEKPTAYVCENFACRMPVIDARALAEQLSVPGQASTSP